MTGDTNLLRQVNPAFIQNGTITSQVFRPTPKDHDKLSVYDGDMITPEKAWTHFTANPDCRSVGVLAVGKNECDEESLPVYSDPQPYPEHAIIDFTGLSKSHVKQKAGRLKSKAEVRGWLYYAK